MSHRRFSYAVLTGNTGQDNTVKLYKIFYKMAHFTVFVIACGTCNVI